jgi:uncharacterized protein (DUF885 family)
MSAADKLSTIAEQVWAELLADEPYYAAKAGLPVEHVPRGDLAQAEAQATRGRRRIAEIEAIPDAELDRTEKLTKATLTWLSEAEVGAPEVHLSTFGVAPYQTGMLSMLPGLIFKPVVFDGGKEDERYLRLAAEFSASIDGMRERLEHQAAAGWRFPKPALPTARAMLENLSGRVAAELMPSDERLASGGPGLGDRICGIVDNELKPAFARLIAAIGEEYEAAAPETVGMGQYPGGQEVYCRTIDRQLSWPADPEEVHATGLEEVARLTAAMADVRARGFGFNDDEMTFHARLREDARARAESPQALEAIYRRHLSRMEPRIGGLFEKRTTAAYDVERLAPELEAGMTFGFYNPGAPGEKGVYYYSALGIETRLQMNAAPLIFHELLPGHHFHIARQKELAALPKIRSEIFPYNAFNEGWAEYSAGLGEEEGLYEDPYDMYGWLTHQRFVAQRLVVDTGLNALGWSLDKARAYMSANTLEGPTQVASETLRYATDMPAQALGYRWGFLKFRELRQRAKDRLGARFDIRRWHEAILSQGGLPMTVLDESLSDWESEELARVPHAAH